MEISAAVILACLMFLSQQQNGREDGCEKTSDKEGRREDDGAKGSGGVVVRRIPRTVCLSVFCVRLVPSILIHRSGILNEKTKARATFGLVAASLPDHTWQ